MSNRKLAEKVVGGLAFGIVAVAFVSLFIIAIAIIDGYVLMKLWEWFVSPTFTLPLLSLPLAIGISMTAGFLCHVPDNRKIPGEQQSLDKTLTNVFLRPAFVLLVGYIVHSYV